MCYDSQPFTLEHYFFATVGNDSVGITSKEYYQGIDFVTVSLRFAQQKYVSYGVSVMPQVPVTFNGNLHDIVQLTLSYNTNYTLQVETAVLCRKNVTTSIILHFGEKLDTHDIVTFLIFFVMINFSIHKVNCGSPLQSNDSILEVTGYRGPPTIEGTIVNFFCSSGLVLNGNKSSKCLRNG